MKHRNNYRFGAMRVLSRRLMRLALPATALVVGAQSAWAGCEINNKDGAGYKTKVINMVIGRIVVPNELAVGETIIAPKPFDIFQPGANNRPWKCTGGGTARGEILPSAVGSPVTTIGKEKVFSTNVKGIGIRLLRLGASGGPTFYPHTLPTSSDFGEFSSDSKFVVELYKTEAVTGSGPLINGIYTTYSGDDGISVLTTTVEANAITIITPTCSVDAGSRNIPVNFGKVPLSEFKGRGTTAAERNFNIKLKCNAGAGTTNAVLLRMDAITDPGGDAGVLRLTQGGTTTATGVGIQIVDGKKVPVTYGAAALVGPSKDGDYVLPFTARYFQTGEKVTPGRADGTATFTIEYQ